ncbi:MAG: hypothetical protein EA385_01980 [Salinarimonadaceae bacterium]|nr:MAG: hypothetical protein EA385_01980 [Salinarimonadaceae bacterium]
MINPVPRSFPAKILRLLSRRFEAGAEPVTLLPCELVSGNGAVLRKIVGELARRWRLGADSIGFIENECLWVDSLVDRIVSQPLDPIGAVAEPYALWAIGDRAGFVAPCAHPAIKVVADIAPYERLKLFVLNLGHSYLADHWRVSDGSAQANMRKIMADDESRARLLELYDEEIIPVFAAAGMEREVRAYIGEVMERFANPFLDHRLAEIAINHAAKVERRMVAFLAWADSMMVDAPRRRLETVIGRL